MKEINTYDLLMKEFDPDGEAEAHGYHLEDLLALNPDEKRIRSAIKKGINQALDIASEQANDPWVSASILDIKNRVK